MPPAYYGQLRGRGPQAYSVLGLSARQEVTWHLGVVKGDVVDATELDRSIRVAAFQWLNAQKAIFGEVLSRGLLEQGFTLQGMRIPIVGPRGIFKPAALNVPLSITTIPGGPYDDDLRDGDSVIHYRYRGIDPKHSDNVGLRTAFANQIPLIFCYRVIPDRYLVSYPVFIFRDDPKSLTFDVQIDDEIALDRYLRSKPGASVETPDERALDRRYITTSAKRRLHQAAFRERVLSAYETRCALCRLKHGALLDAAHIIPDGEPGGEPEVSNGLALCKIHHAAFDLNYLGITPKYKVEVRAELMEEIDGPMLQHGIKAMHGQSIILPKAKANRPSEVRLEARFERFIQANKTP